MHRWQVVKWGKGYAPRLYWYYGRRRNTIINACFIEILWSWIVKVWLLENELVFAHLRRLACCCFEIMSMFLKVELYYWCAVHWLLHKIGELIQRWWDLFGESLQSPLSISLIGLQDLYDSHELIWFWNNCFVLFHWQKQMQMVICNCVVKGKTDMIYDLFILKMSCCNVNAIRMSFHLIALSKVCQENELRCGTKYFSRERLWDYERVELASESYIWFKR